MNTTQYYGRLSLKNNIICDSLWILYNITEDYHWRII